MTTVLFEKGCMIKVGEKVIVKKRHMGMFCKQLKTGSYNVQLVDVKNGVFTWLIK